MYQLLFDYWCGASIILLLYNVKDPLFEKFGIEQVLLLILFSWLMVPLLTLSSIIDVLENGFLKVKDAN